MIDYLRHMAIFARVVEEGSFRAAAQAVGLAPSRVSETVSELEHYLGVTLLYRTTRKIALTNEGQVFHARVVEMLRSAEAGLNELNALSQEPAGELRVSMPAFLSSSCFSTAMADFVQQYPLAALSVSFTDHPVGLIDTGFDVNIRVGWLDDSSMMSRKLGEEDRLLVAGTEYATLRPTPVHPKDLEEWDWVRYEHRSDTVKLQSDNGEVARVVGRSRIQVDSVEAVHHLTRQNLGVAILPQHLATQGLESGDFVELLPAWKLRPLGFYAVWPDKSRRENLTLVFVRFLADSIVR